MNSAARSATDIAELFIGAAITPALLFTACALLLSGLQGKYSTLVSAIRTLGAERRQLEAVGSDAALRRRDNVGQQIHALLSRARLVRNSLFCLYAGILLLLLASLCGGMAAIGIVRAATGTLVFFASGMISVVAAMGFGFVEAQRSFEILRLESMSDDYDGAVSGDDNEVGKE